MDPEGHRTVMSDNFYVEFYTKGVITVASCLALCPAVGLMGRRYGLLMFMIITALASLLQLGLLNCEYKVQLNYPATHTTHTQTVLPINHLVCLSSNRPS